MAEATRPRKTGIVRAPLTPNRPHFHWMISSSVGLRCLMSHQKKPYADESVFPPVKLGRSDKTKTFRHGFFAQKGARRLLSRNDNRNKKQTWRSVQSSACFTCSIALKYGGFPIIQNGAVGGNMSRKSQTADRTIFSPGASGFKSIATTSEVFSIKADTKAPPPAEGSKTKSPSRIGSKPTKNAASSRGV